MLRRIWLVSFFWRIKVLKALLFTKKIKVGFGPITSGERDFAERKWRIDPIIDEINRTSDCYAAGFFISPKKMKKYDLIVIAKKFKASYIPIIKSLKLQNKRFIYDIIDNPNCDAKYGSYLETPAFTELMDAFILSSPLQQKRSTKSMLIEHPVINSSYKTEYKNSGEIVLLAQGYYENLKNLRFLEPLLPKISEEIGKKVILVYHCETEPPLTDSTRYIPWSVKNCFSVMNDADIAVTIKDLHKRHQKTKPSTKVIAYMAAALPVICFPSVADRLVINHGVNGLFAYTPNDWKFWIQKLAKNSKLRSQIGRAARASVKDRFSVAEITKKYIQLFDRI